MDNEQTPQTPVTQKVCTLRVLFSANSDDEAIEVKKKISTVLAELPDVKVEFSIMESNRVRRV